MIKVVFFNRTGEETVVEYTEADIAKFGEGEIAKISDLTLEWSDDLVTYIIVDDDGEKK